MLNLKKSINYKRLSLHLLFWTFHIFYFAFFYGFPDKFWNTVVLNLYSLSFDAAIVYFTIYFLLPKFLAKSKLLLFGISFLMTIVFGIYLQSILITNILFPVPEKVINLLSFKQVLGFFYINSPATYYNLVIYISAVIIKLTKTWYEQRIKYTEIENKKTKIELQLKDAELKLLKAQIHPHFSGLWRHHFWRGRQ